MMPFAVYVVNDKFEHLIDSVWTTPEEAASRHLSILKEGSFFEVTTYVVKGTHVPPKPTGPRGKSSKRKSNPPSTRTMKLIDSRDEQ